MGQDAQVPDVGGVLLQAGDLLHAAGSCNRNRPLVHPPDSAAPSHRTRGGKRDGSVVRVQSDTEPEAPVTSAVC